MQHILTSLSDPEFIRGAALLLITAILTGILVPQIVAALSEKRNRSQKLFEADIVRQRDVLAAQSELLKELGKYSWKFQLLNINVSYCRIESTTENFNNACVKYQAESAELLGQIRAELSTTKRLVSEGMYQELRSLYFDTLLAVDSHLEILIRTNSTATNEQWRAQHDVSFGQAQGRIETTLSHLAQELLLTSPNAKIDA
jgi:hypothetical protein